MSQLPNDGGPIYAETDFHSFFVEPWNSISSLAIVLPAIYWAIRLKFDFKNYPFIFYGIPLLVLGGMGSTLYHAFRNSQLLLIMDVAPTALLTLSVGIYFWMKVLKKWWKVILVVLPATLFRIYIFELFPDETGVNISYFITGALIFIPVLLYLFLHHFRYYKSIFISVFFLSLSLLFREIDTRVTEYLPMGTHFLWHLMSGIGAYYLAKYLYLLRAEELKLQIH